MAVGEAPIKAAVKWIDEQIRDVPRPTASCSWTRPVVASI